MTYNLEYADENLDREFDKQVVSALFHGLFTVLGIMGTPGAAPETPEAAAKLALSIMNASFPQLEMRLMPADGSAGQLVQ